MSNNIGWPSVTAAQNQKEVTINDQAQMLDAALTESLSVSLTSSVTLTTAQFRSAFMFVATGTAAGAQLIVPSVKRPFAVANTGANALDVKTGSSAAVSIAAGASSMFYTDGAALYKMT